MPEPIRAEEIPTRTCPRRNIVLLTSSLTPSKIAISVFRFLAVRCVWIAITPASIALFISCKKFVSTILSASRIITASNLSGGRLSTAKLRALALELLSYEAFNKVMGNCAKRSFVAFCIWSEITTISNRSRGYSWQRKERMLSSMIRSSL